MTLKHTLFITFILLLIQGCSTINESDNPTDSVEMSPALKSTHDILEANNQKTDEIIDEQNEEYSDNTKNITQFDSVWLQIVDLYQLNDIDNKRIQQQVKWYLKHKKHIVDVSKRASTFLYLITEEVKKRNMPGEIALLPFIESSFIPSARSSMKAAGLWQFIPSTGRYFGLKQNWWYDGRQDVYQSTMAALTYLEQLNKYYDGDWLLALAAYNAGAGNIDKAIRKNRKKGKPMDYWSLSLPKETYKYIARLLSVSKIVKNHQSYGISLYPIENSPRLRLVDTISQIDLSVVAEMSNSSLKEIRAYNPGFKQWATDPEGPHYLLIPIEQFEEYEKQLAVLDKKDRVKWYRHKIRSGESLSVIAHRYRISVSALKEANKLKNNRIRAGKYLMVPAGNKESLITQNMTAQQTDIVNNKTQSTKRTINYKVRKGDSFWKIARRHGISHKRLASLNGLSSGDILSIGQVLTITQEHTNTKNNNTEMISYKVKSGDSLYTISKLFKVSINDLQRWNQLNIKKYLKPGQELKVFVNSSSQTI